MRWLIVFAVIFACVVNLNAEWYKPEWKFRKQLKMDDKLVQGELKNFPVCIQLPDSETDFYDAVKPDGGDVVFTDDDGKTELPYEIELINREKKQFVCWVQLPEFKSGAPCSLYLYYGRPDAAAPTESAKKMWGSDYVAVWHMSSREKDGVKYAPDSAGGFNLQAAGKAAFVNGKIGIAGESDNDPKSCFSYGYYSGEPAPKLSANDSFSLSMWVSMKSIQSNFFNDWPLMFYYHNSGRWQFNLMKQKGIAGHCYCPDKSPLDRWVYMSAVYDGQAKTLSLYINGQLSGDSAKAVEFCGLREKSVLTILPGTAGMADEIRLEQIARPATWIKACYENQNNPASITCGKAENQ